MFEYRVCMTTTSGKNTSKPAATRDDRLKAALKANMAKRKAQAKARAGTGAKKDEGS